MMESLHSSHVDVALTLEDHMFCSVLMEGGTTIPQSVHQFLKSVASCVATSGMYKLTPCINHVRCINLLHIDLYSLLHSNCNS